MYLKVNILLALLILLSAGKTDKCFENSMKEISYLALGDSYTIGESVEPTESFPYLLTDELSKYGISVKEKKIIAKTGWTTEDLKTGITNAEIVGKTYDLISLLIGVNNQYQGKSIEEYKEEFAELLQLSIDFANGNKNKVFVLSIPDYGYTPFGQSNQTTISEAIDQFNKSNKAICDSAGVRYFDITGISRKGLEDPSLIAPDDLHPSGKMYSQWVELISKEVAELVKEN